MKTKLQRWLSVVLLVCASCAVPPRIQAASVKLEWTDNSAAPDAATLTRVFEQTPAGVVLGTLPGLWTQLGTRIIVADENAAVAGRQNTFVIVDVKSGPHTYAVVANNAAGDSPPSNAAGVTVVASVPSAHTSLTATVNVP